jgi:hypothetical protein
MKIRMIAVVTLLLCGFIAADCFSARAYRHDYIEHVTVYREADRFCGWPANNGAWIWDNEILVCFTLNYFQEPDPNVDPTEHHRDRNRDEEIVMARSLDGGQTWELERPEAFSLARKDEKAIALTEELDFTAEGFAMGVWRDKFHVSYDRGKTWKGPYQLPDLGDTLGGRTDYIVDGKNSCTIFISARNSPLCVLTTDGGKNFEVVGKVMPRTDYHAIMPSSVRISDSELVSAVRQIRTEAHVSWIDVYSSDDNGQAWKFRSKVADADNKYWNGNPPSMVKLRDGKLAVTYGYRAVPYGIRAKISSDNGKTWGQEIILRRDGRNWDLGYTRSVQRADGKVVTMYYYSTKEYPQQRISATIWDAARVNDYSDEREDFERMWSYVSKMEEAVMKINEIAGREKPSVNEMVYWTQIKEKNCDRLREVISCNFLSERVMPDLDSDGKVDKGYENELMQLNEILLCNMKVKRTDELSNVEHLRILLARFRRAHFVYVNPRR